MQDFATIQSGALVWRFVMRFQSAYPSGQVTAMSPCHLELALRSLHGDWDSFQNASWTSWEAKTRQWMGLCPSNGEIRSDHRDRIIMTIGIEWWYMIIIDDRDFIIISLWSSMMRISWWYLRTLFQALIQGFVVGGIHCAPRPEVPRWPTASQGPFMGHRTQNSRSCSSCPRVLPRS